LIDFPLLIYVAGAVKTVHQLDGFGAVHSHQYRHAGIVAGPQLYARPLKSFYPAVIAIPPKYTFYPLDGFFGGQIGMRMASPAGNQAEGKTKFPKNVDDQVIQHPEVILLSNVPNQSGQWTVGNQTVFLALKYRLGLTRGSPRRPRI
jgi:hypothetical protein